MHLNPFVHRRDMNGRKFVLVLQLIREKTPAKNPLNELRRNTYKTEPIFGV